MEEGEYEEFELGLGLDNLMEDRDYLYRLVNSIDWEAQLDAIKAVLRRNEDSSLAVAAHIDDLKEQAENYRGPHHEHVVDNHTDAVWRSSYSEAAKSMSAIGMIIPMVESAYSQSLQALGGLYAAKGLEPPPHKRWVRAGAHEQRWNCQFYFGSDGAKPDIISGIRQISAATGLTAYMPDGAPDWLDAMLTYRNKMFHGGFEWSLDQRDQFEEQIAQRKWERFFNSARSGHKPWIFYLQDGVIAQMPAMVEGILDSLGRFAKELPFELISRP